MRNKFLKFAAIGAAVPALLSTQGCSQADVLKYAQAFLGAAEAVEAADPSIPELATVVASLKTVIANFNFSSTSCGLISAAADVASILDTILPSSVYANLASVALAGFDVLISSISPCVTSAPAASVMAHAARPKVSRLRGSASYTAAAKKFKGSMFPLHAFKSEVNSAASKAGLRVKLS